MRPRTLFATGTKFDRTQLKISLLFNRLCIIDDLNLEDPHLDEDVLLADLQTKRRKLGGLSDRALCGILR